jgi:hypothetical protein
MHGDGLPPLIGRARELQDLLELVRGAPRLITVVGLAGVGKSRLVDEAFRGGAPPEPLRQVDGLLAHTVPIGPDAPEATLLRALGCEPGGPPDRVGRVLAALGPALLVLDGVEGAVEPLTAQLPAWLAAAPELTILVTSRVALGLAAETRLALEPLRPDDALALLEERARRLRRDLQLDDASARALVSDLDGLPGALEWAAAQLATVSVGDLTDILRAGEAGTLGFASGGPTLVFSSGGPTPPWTRGLDWSVRSLSEPLRAGLMRLAAYCRPLPARDAAEVVGGLGPLAELRNASLVGPASASDPRIRVYRTVCHVLAGPAWHGERAIAADAHAARVVARSGALDARMYGSDGPEALSALAQLEVELRAVVTRGLGLSGEALSFPLGAARALSFPLGAARALSFPLGAARALSIPLELTVEATERLGTLQVFGRGEGIPEAWFEVLLGKGALTAIQRATLLFERAGGRLLRGRIDAALADLAAARAQVPGETRLAARVALLKSAAQRRLGAKAEAAATAREALAWARASGRTEIEVEALSLLAKVAPTRVEHDQLARTAVQLARATGDSLGLMGPLLTLADSPDDFREGLAIAEQAGFARASYYFNASLSNRLLEDGGAEASRRHHEAAVALARRNGWDRLTRECRAIHAVVRWSLDPGADCRPALRRALTDGRGEADQEMLLSFLHAAEAEAAPASPPLPIPERSPAAALCAAAAELHRAGADGPERAVAAIARARKLLEPPPEPPVTNERAARRIVERALAGLEAERDAAAVWVGPGGAWFALGDGPRVSLARRLPLQRLLLALSSAQAALTVEALFAAGWPGQSIRPASAAHRVYVAVNELRRLGLGDRLQTADGGYRLEVAPVAAPVRRRAGS